LYPLLIDLNPMIGFFYLQLEHPKWQFNFLCVLASFLKCVKYSMMRFSVESFV